LINVWNSTGKLQGEKQLPFTVKKRAEIESAGLVADFYIMQSWKNLPGY